MNYRFYITALSSRVEVFPLNFRSTSLVDAREKDKIYYRRSFSGSLIFTDNNGGDDFSLFYLIEATSPYERLILEIEQKDSGADTYHNYWTGYFSTPDGAFDLDRCTFTVTPRTYDDYMNFDISGETEYNIITELPAEVSTFTLLMEYSHNRYLMDVVEMLVQNIEPSATITSWFFNNEYNPVTGDINKYRYLTIAQKSDIKRPESSNPATIAMLSFNQLMEIIRGMYNVYWKWDGSVFRLEHLSYWDNEAGLDLRTQSISQKQNKYSYQRNKMPRYEKFSFMEAFDSNYTTHTITYDENCTDIKTVNEYSNNVTTDLTYIETAYADSQLATPEGLMNNISDDGWVIIANYKQDVTNHVYYGKAYENDGATYNYPNSWSYLLRAFFLHGRVMKKGLINTTLVDFISVVKTKKQSIKAIVCYENDYNPADYITTELGEDWLGGQKGFVDTATIHPDGLVEFDLVYGEDDETEIVMPPQPKILHCVITGGFIYSTLSEPNIYDTYYWIWWDDGEATEECQEIFIAAGDTYVVDTRPDFVTTYKFNVSDDSLDGWTFVVNDNEDADLSVRNIQCGGSVPPAIPAPPVLSTPSQSAPCEPLWIHWTASAGATYYKVLRKPSNLLADIWEAMANPISTEWYDYQAGETNGYEWCYKVQACNISGCSADSNEECFTHPIC